MTHTWVIEDNIPIPEQKQGRSYNRTGISKALKSMNVGQSTLAPDNAPWCMSRIGSLSVQTGMRFTTRTTDEGLRIWRVE